METLKRWYPILLLSLFLIVVILVGAPNAMKIFSGGIVGGQETESDVHEISLMLGEMQSDLGHVEEKFTEKIGEMREDLKEIEQRIRELEAR
jgi:hypothetical protein